MTAFYQTGSELDFKADFSQGPNQGAGVPFASPDDVGTSVSTRMGGVECRILRPTRSPTTFRLN
jgi:hypothetical protein